MSANEKTAKEAVKLAMLQGLAELETKLNNALAKAVDRNELSYMDSQAISAFFELGVDLAKKEVLKEEK